MSSGIANSPLDLFASPQVSDAALAGFHPLIRRWFESRFAGPTEPQTQGWPAIAAGQHTLIAAPTGSGKTLTAFLACIDRLLKEALTGELPDETRVVYVSPLRALSNDMHRNLEVPLAEILALAEREGSPIPPIRAGLRTGDTTSSQRAALIKRPPHILVTTPESLYLLLTARKGRETLRAVETVIVDEIHALVRDKRGSHLALSLERLESLVAATGYRLPATREEGTLACASGSNPQSEIRNSQCTAGGTGSASASGDAGRTTRRLQRIGLSATQKPIERMAEFLVGVPAAGEEDTLACASGSAADEGPLACASGSDPKSEIRNSQCTAGGTGSASADRSDTYADRQKLQIANCKLQIANQDFDTNPQSEIRNPRSSAPLACASGSGSSESNPKFAIRNSRCECTIVDVGHGRELDLAIEVPPSELGPVCMHEQWEEVNARLVELINSHRSTLIFVNTRKLAERLTFQLTELLGKDVVGAHHGSLSAEIRLNTERRLKSGELKAVVATASLELGLDVGYIDLVVQIGSPRSIATFLQRIGRSGHSLGLIPKGRLFALSRDELLECMAVLLAIREGRLDITPIPDGPLDVLAQQIVAEVAAVEDCNADELFALFSRAYPYRRMSRRDFDRTLEYLSEGISNAHGRGRAYLHYDRVQQRLRARRGSRIAAVSNAGAIPEIASYRVVAEPDQTVVGSLDEDFSVESNRGDVFLLGNTSWRILHVRGGDVTVVDAQGAPPTIPFWRGEAPGRTLELSQEVSRLREVMESRLEDPVALERWLIDETHCTEAAAKQVVAYCAAQKAAVGLLPTTKRVVFERFFDETGGMQLVVHAPFGSAINKAWGFAMRKRFCRSFDFELQATADDDGFILSLGPQHSFPIESLFPMLTRHNARGLLEQAVLTVPMFQVRWRWNVTRALLVLRRRNGQKVPPALQRFRADDLLTAVFPKLTGCQEEHTGDHELPDHPLTQQTMYDCLHEALDIDGLERVLEQIERGEITLVARDTREPSPFSYELLNSNVYAFLDGGEIQERRARAVSTRRSMSIESVSDLGRLDPEAIARVREEAQPLIRSADELHDALLSRVMMEASTDYRLPATGGEAIDYRLQAIAEERMGGTGSASAEAADTICNLQFAINNLQSPAGDEGTLACASGSDASVCNSQSAIRNPQSNTPLACASGSNSNAVGAGEDLSCWFSELAAARRATTLVVATPDGEAKKRFWVSAERLAAALAAFPDAMMDPQISVPRGVRTDWTSEEARVAMLRGMIEVCGPVTTEDAATRLAMTPSQAFAAFEALEGEGVVLRGRFTEPATGGEATDYGLQTTGEEEVGGTGSASADSADVHAANVNSLACASGSAADEGTLACASGSGSSESNPRSAIRNPQSTSSTEWCHRRLLARIHRLTMEGLRKQIEPVTVDVFIRYLARHHGLLGADRRSGTNGLYEVLQMLEGLDIPAIAWERDLLPARLKGYRSEWLDELCLEGEIGWGRLFPPPRNPDRSRPMVSLTRVAPVSLFLRANLDWLTACATEAEVESLSGPAREVYELLGQFGAMFAADLMGRTRMLPSQLDEALGELISRGLVTADGFGGLRRLIADKSGSAPRHDRRRARFRTRRQSAGAGRWSLWRPATGDRLPTTGGEAVSPTREQGAPDGSAAGGTGSASAESSGSEAESRKLQIANQDSGSNPQSAIRNPKSEILDLTAEAVEHWAWLLLRRWGVVFRDLLMREAGAPRWYELLSVYRRLEARGEIRGGRFIRGVAGEQFALGDTVRELRKLRDAGTEEELVVVNAADPLNLVGILTQHPRVTSIATNRVAYLNGVPVGSLQAGEIQFFDEAPEHLRTLIAARLKGEAATDYRLPTTGGEEMPLACASGSGAEERTLACASGSDASASNPQSEIRNPKSIDTLARASGSGVSAWRSALTGLDD